MTTWDKYAGGAERWSEGAYADPHRYLARRADLVVGLGPRLREGDTVLDLACGDGGLADFLPRQRYAGVDASAAMVEAGRSRGRDIRLGDLNHYVPDEPVAATTIFRAIYYAGDRRALLARIAGYTTTKLVFDLNPRQFHLDGVRGDLESAGFTGLDTRPFFVPQTHALPVPVAFGLRLLERSGPAAEVLLRRRFTLLCAAYRVGGRTARS